MDVKNIRDATDWFEVLQTSKRTQTAMMTLRPGKSSGSEPEGHKNSDQILLVLKGEVEGEIANETITLREGDVIMFAPATKPCSREFSQCVWRRIPPIRRSG